jgi:hypothetical protein
MSETGWPLIPREVLPAPVPAAKATVRRPVTHADLGRQLSIFGAETTEPSPADLAGLLAGPGRLERMGGTARISVRVDAAWRVHVLVAELVSRGLVVSWSPVAAAGKDGGGPAARGLADDGLADGGLEDGGLEDGGPEDGGPRELSREPFEMAEAPDPDAERAADETSVASPAGKNGGARPAGKHGGARPAGKHGGARAAGKRGTESPDGKNGGEGETHDTAKDAENAKSAKSDEAGSASVAPPDQDPDPGTGAGDAPEGSRVDVASFEVRTAYSSRLKGLARSWPAAADQLFLSGPRLRLWVAAAGEPRPGGYALGLNPESGEQGKNHEIIDAALVRAGLAGRVSDDGRYWLILGRKRLRRLAELVGDRPPAAPEATWPGGAAA